ncbi:MAG: septal ring lytic transglycosylase RlpA family protein [Pseudomonadota bacterium]|nr:MAG: septal ring lytic transglycosylase RlpA family protein [Pseudomonadota bacterium]
MAQVQPATTRFIPIAIGLLVIMALLAGCASKNSRYSRKHDGPPTREVEVAHIPDATPRAEPRSRYGNNPTYKVNGKRYHVMKSSRGYRERGVASWYGAKFHGHRTSSGDPYNMYAMTAAHKSLPLPTYVQVTNLANGSTVIVRVNDRGPFHKDRIIDLSYAAAKKLGITAGGTGVVEVRAIDPDAHPHDSAPVRQAEQGTPLTPQDAPASRFSLYLQVGAFASRQNAEKLHDTLVFLHESVLIDAAPHNDDTIYRVRIGPLSSVEEADRLAARIAELGMAAPHIVVN